MIWITGEKGMLGVELFLAMERAGLERVGSDREVDMTDGAVLRGFAEGKAVRWLVNCAAYTAVDKAELCRWLNVDGAAETAMLSERIGARLVHVSTDYVFDGNGGHPYREDERTNPTGVYGKTKRDGGVGSPSPLRKQLYTEDGVALWEAWK